MRLFIPMALSAALVSWGAAAQTQTTPSPEAAPAVQHQGDISFVSGGIGLGDRAQLNDMAANYNLRLTFAVRPSGQYLADIGVTLVDASGQKVLDTVASGPLFYAHVPAGRYSVTVTNDGKPETRSIDIGPGRAASQSFYWSYSG